MSDAMTLTARAGSAVLLFAVACDRPEPPPELPQESPQPVFAIELWPGEGVPRFESLVDVLPLREAPVRSAPVAMQIGNAKGMEINFDSTRFQTLETGRIVAIAPATVNGRVLGATQLLTRDAYYHGGFPTESRTVQPGDTIEFLQYRAEGTCFVRIAGDVIDADPCPAMDASAFRSITEPRVEWWIHVTSKTGRGWLHVDDSVVKKLPRVF